MGIILNGYITDVNSLGTNDSNISIEECIGRRVGNFIAKSAVMR